MGDEWKKAGTKLALLSEADFECWKEGVGVRKGLRCGNGVSILKREPRIRQEKGRRARNSGVFKKGTRRPGSHNHRKNKKDWIKKSEEHTNKRRVWDNKITDIRATITKTKVRVSAAP